MSDINKHTSGAVDSVVDSLAKRQDDLLSDFKIKCEGHEWKVHKVILAMHSPVLAVAVTRDFQELKQGFIDLSEDGPEFVTMLVSYLYKLDYEQNADASIDFHIKMCILADKYDIPPLRAIASGHFKAAATMETMTKSEYAAFCEAIKCAYSAPDVTEDIRSHIVVLLVDCDAMGLAADFQGSALQAVMRVYPDVAIEVALALREQKKAKPLNRVKCCYCGENYQSGSFHYC